jgi:hypothetical protein
MEIKKTVTSIFMVPMLNIPKGELRNNGFLNAYYRDDIWDKHPKNVIFLLFRPEDINRFIIFLDSENERTESVIEDYCYPDGFFVVAYQLNPKLKKDFDLVRLGKYSKTSPRFQKQFPKIVTVEKSGIHIEELSIQYRIFNKTIDLVKYWEDAFDTKFDKEQEVWDGFIEKNEILNIDKIKEYLQEDKS